MVSCANNALHKACTVSLGGLSLCELALGVLFCDISPRLKVGHHSLVDSTRNAYFHDIAYC